ncbi:hypothetical protein BDW74DRAFT_183065 [Aspergillus multicolor]|uniref:uncharacterized protein n=1 Tax=Aspergillus multicolor TaxID=41759 RepID=UPI003CCD09BA
MSLLSSVECHHGFFYAVNPPVSYEKMGKRIEFYAAMHIVKALFRLPEEELLKIHVDNSQGVRGYLPFKFSDGSNRRASFSTGRDYTNPEQHFVAVAPPGTVSINQWPGEALRAFRESIYEFYGEVFRFARKMLQIFALALELDETDLDNTFRHPLNDVTLQYYPIQDASDQSSISPHADYGGFTLLYQDQVGGLEVLNANGIWIPAPPKEHSYIFNTGNYMEVLSNGHFPATVHRAFGNPTSERFSIPFFFNPDPTSIVVPHPKLVPNSEKPEFEPHDINRRTLQAMMSNRPHHPSLEKLKELGLDEEQMGYDLLLKTIDKIKAEMQPKC